MKSEYAVLSVVATALGPSLFADLEFATDLGKQLCTAELTDYHDGQLQALLGLLAPSRHS
jgi:hypothetical protein